MSKRSLMAIARICKGTSNLALAFFIGTALRAFKIGVVTPQAPWILRTRRAQCAEAEASRRRPCCSTPALLASAASMTGRRTKTVMRLRDWAIRGFARAAASAFAARIASWAATWSTLLTEGDNATETAVRSLVRGA